MFTSVVVAVTAFRDCASRRVRCSLGIGRVGRMPAAEHARSNPRFEFFHFEHQLVLHPVSPPFVFSCNLEIPATSKTGTVAVKENLD
jgi:hypothetical protein